MNWLNVIVVLFLTNFLWIIGVLIGLIFLGIFPSTFSLIETLSSIQNKNYDISYMEVTKTFVKAYLRQIRTRKLINMFFLIFTLFFILDFSFISINPFASAIFKIPLTIFLVVFLFGVINFGIVDYKSNNSLRDKLKFSLLMPWTFPLQSLISLLLIITFLLISFRFSWFSFVSISLFMYTNCRILSENYIKKGLLKYN